MSGEQAKMEIIRRWFERDGWSFHSDDEPTVIRMRCSTDSESWGCCARWVERLDVFLFECLMDARLPAACHGEALRFIATMNFHSSYGNWDMDLRDGEVRFRASVDIEGMELSDQVIHNVVYGCLRGMRNHHHRFEAIAAGASAADVFEDVRQGRPTPVPGDDESTGPLKDAARLLANGLFDEAIKAWMSIAERWPTREGLAWSQVGTAFYLKGDHATAIHYFEKAKEAGEQGMDENIDEAVEAMVAV